MARVAAGNIGGATAALPPGARAAFAQAARASYSSGFALILLVAGIIALLGAVLVFALVHPPSAAAAAAVGDPRQDRTAATS